MISKNQQKYIRQLEQKNTVSVKAYLSLRVLKSLVIF